MCGVAVWRSKPPCVLPLDIKGEGYGVLPLGIKGRVCWLGFEDFDEYG